MFSKEYLMAKITYLEGQLARLPKVTLGRCREHKVVNIYKGVGANSQRNRYYLSSKEGKYFLDLYNIRDSIKNELKTIFAEHPFLKNERRVTIKPVKLLPYSIREKLVPDCNPTPKTGDYWYKKTQMRSRLEIVTAKVLDSMGLEFMYEPCININGDEYYPDFLVFLPELGCCFIIECLGRADDRGYLFKNINKLIDYIYIGFDVNLNYLLFRGTINYIPDPSLMEADIEHLINNLARSVIVS